ncbi:Urease accessory protein [Marine Group I thaumarchaeote]|jgi:urease accessory protein|nr:Urease accessory protein [Marine Group I thaumarchaeote]|tara:strand:- start:2108 stop:2605 length:498 start_codon:yes stop_codon:yes gene_type:complete
MLIVNTVLGNIYKDDQLAKKIEDSKEQGKFRRLLLSRIEMEKSRLRKKTDDGFDIGFVLEPGTKLQHGDVISESDETILIEQLPEKTLTVKFKQNDKNLFLLVGHIIGNRHRPISIRNETISFPIHDNSEMELFERLFHEVIHEIDLSIDEQRFIPHTSMDVHEH